MPIKHLFRIPSGEILNVLKKGRRIVGTSFDVFFASNKKPFSRFTVIAPKNSIKTAVTRNAAKRFVWGEIIKKQNPPEGLDIVIKVKREISAKSAKKEINDLTEKIS